MHVNVLTVVAQKGKGSPVYKVKPECGSGRGRIFHHNMLMPCNALPVEEPVQKAVQKQKQHGQRKLMRT